jgi:hypothetical protein
MPYPKVSADDIRAKLDASQEAPETPAEPRPDPSAKPPAWCGSVEELVLQFWQEAALPGGDIAMLIRLPESFALALRGEGERHGFTLGQQLLDLIQRLDANGYL